MPGTRYQVVPVCAFLANNIGNIEANRHYSEHCRTISSAQALILKRAADIINRPYRGATTAAVPHQYPVARGLCARSTYTYLNGNILRQQK